MTIENYTKALCQSRKRDKRTMLLLSKPIKKVLGLFFTEIKVFSSHNMVYKRNNNCLKSLKNFKLSFSAHVARNVSHIFETSNLIRMSYSEPSI